MQRLTLIAKHSLFESLPHPFNKNWRPFSNKARHHGCESCGQERAIWVKKALKESRRSLLLETADYLKDAQENVVDDVYFDYDFDDNYD